MLEQMINRLYYDQQETLKRWYYQVRMTQYMEAHTESGRFGRTNSQLHSQQHLTKSVKLGP
jgi:hypothetical protein